MYRLLSGRAKKHFERLLRWFLWRLSSFGWVFMGRHPSRLWILKSASNRSKPHRMTSAVL